MTKDTVKIHGKEYETVASRVNRFRGDFMLDYSIRTELVSRDENAVVMKALISDKDGRVIATGYAEENRSASSINKTSALENCETSAIGRALAAFGMAGTEYASADEVAQAITQQNAPKKATKDIATPKQREMVSKLLNEQQLVNDSADIPGYIIERFGVEVPLTKEGASFVIEELLAAVELEQSNRREMQDAAAYVDKDGN